MLAYCWGSSVSLAARCAADSCDLKFEPRLRARLNARRPTRGAGTRGSVIDWTPTVPLWRRNFLLAVTRIDSIHCLRARAAAAAVLAVWPYNGFRESEVCGTSTCGADNRRVRTTTWYHPYAQ